MPVSKIFVRHEKTLGFTTTPTTTTTIIDAIATTAVTMVAVTPFSCEEECDSYEARPPLVYYYYYYYYYYYLGLGPQLLRALGAQGHTKPLTRVTPWKTL